MKKRFLSVMLAIAMVFTFTPTALATGTQIVFITNSSGQEVTQVQAGDSINLKVTFPEMQKRVGSFTVELKFDNTKFEVTNAEVPAKVTDANTTGEITSNLTEMDNTTYETKAVVTNANRDGVLTANYASTNDALVLSKVTAISVTLKAKTDASGAAAFSFNKFEVTNGSGGVTTNVLTTSDIKAIPSVTILKAPMATATASVDDPVRGTALDSGVDVGGATAYTATVEWYEGSSVTETTALASGTKAKANTNYTAKITLTAKTAEGESFAKTGFTAPTGYTASVSEDGKTVVLTKTFEKTANKDTPTITTLPTATGITYGQTLNDSTLNGGVAKINDTEVLGTFDWSNKTTAPKVSDSNTTEYEVTFKPNDTVNYADATCKVKLAVNPKEVTNPTFEGVEESYVYTGSEITIENLSLKDGETEIPSSEYSVSYSNNKNAGTATITVTDAAGGNYTVSGSKTFEITKGFTGINITVKPQITYDGSAIVVAKKGTSEAANADITYEYAGDGVVTVNCYSCDSSFTRTGSAISPTDAGTYIVDISAADGENYKAVSIQSKVFTISPKNIRNANAIFSIASTSLTYNGSEQTRVVNSVTVDNRTLTAGTDYTVEGNSATNAGTHRFTIKGIGNYTGSYTNYFEFTIKPLPVALEWSGYSNRSYDGSASNVTATVSNKCSSDEVTVVVTNGNKTDAGTYTATATSLTGTAANNYTLEGTTNTTQAYTISPALITGTEQAFKANSVVYDGEAHTITVDKSKITTGNNQTVAITYGESEFGCNNPNPPTLTDVGTKTVYWSVTAPNHVSQSGSTTITISQKDASGLDESAPDQNTVLGVGTFADPIIKLNKNDATGLPGTYAYKMTVKESGSDVTKVESSDNNKQSVINELNKLVKDDVATLKYTFTPDDKTNYTGTKTGTFTVTVKDVAFTIDDAGTAPTVANAITLKDNPTYGDTWAQIVQKKSGVTFTASVIDQKDTDQSHFTIKQTGTPSAGDSQTWQLVYNGTIGDKTYTDVVVLSGTVNVAQKELTVTPSGKVTKVYDGTTEATNATNNVTLSCTGLVGQDSVTATTSTLGTFESADVGTGKMTVTAQLTGDKASNYKIKGGNSIEVDTEITPATVAVFDLSVNEKTYDGSDVVTLNTSSVTFTGIVSADANKCELDTSGVIASAEDDEAGDNKNVTVSGKFALKAKTGETFNPNNYTLTQPTGLKVTIKKASKENVALNASAKYGTTGSINLSSWIIAGGIVGTIATSEDTNNVVVGTGENVPALTDGVLSFTFVDSSDKAGSTAKITVPIKSNNYDNYNIVVTVTVADKDVPVVSGLAGKTGLVYNGSDQELITAGTTTGGTLGYKVGQEDKGSTVPTGKNAGAYDVIYHVTGNDTYADIQDVTLPVTIAPKSVTVAPKDITITKGDTVPEFELAYSGLVGTDAFTASATPTFTLTDASGNTVTADEAKATAGTYTITWTNVGAVTFSAAAGTTAGNYNLVKDNEGTLTVNNASYSGGGGGAAIIVQKPVITNGSNGSYTLSTDGTTATFTPNAGYEFDKVTVNGKEVTLKNGKLTGLKTGDKVEVTYKQATDAADKQISEVKEKVAALSLKARSSKTAKKNVKVVASLSAEAKAAISDIQNLGYTVKYKFYRSTKKASGYKAMLTSMSGKYTNTIGKKGTMYYYKLRVMVYDANGNLVTQSALKQCKYANRLWTK